MRYRSRHFYAWSPAIAYTVGLIASDGCLQRDGRHIDLTSKDLEQLINFAKALGRELPIGQKTSSQGNFAYRIQFGDVAYYDFLTKVGITPSKSKTMGPLIIPDEFYADFLLGLFDGDGSCYGYMDPRWRSSFMFYTQFTSASPVFIEYLRSTNSWLIGVSGGSLKPGKRALLLSYAKEDSYKLFKYMYYEGHVTSLTRKKVKLKGFIQQDQVGIIS